MVFQNIPIFHSAIFKYPLDNPCSVLIDVKILGVDVPKQTLIQAVKIGGLFHSCSCKFLQKYAFFPKTESFFSFASNDFLSP